MTEQMYGNHLLWWMLLKTNYQLDSSISSSSNNLTTFLLLGFNFIYWVVLLDLVSFIYANRSYWDGNCYRRSPSETHSVELKQLPPVATQQHKTIKSATTVRNKMSKLLPVLLLHLRISIANEFIQESFQILHSKWLSTTFVWWDIQEQYFITKSDLFGTFAFNTFDLDGRFPLGNVIQVNNFLKKIIIVYPWNYKFKTNSDSFILCKL